MNFEFEAIGTIESCFKEKFGIPRQSGLVQHAHGIVKLLPDPDLKTAIKTLETFSHLWLLFVFHEHGSRKWKPSIRPPRLGGAEKVGVLASRSPHRPNPIGLSAVRLERIDLDAPGGPELHVSGVDLLDGTPILDIKPYVTYADSIPDAKSGWADEPIQRIAVIFSDGAAEKIQTASRGYPKLRELIEELIGLDPRPAAQKRRLPADAPESQGKHFGMNLLGYDVQWEIHDGKFVVVDLVNLPEGAQK